MVWESGVLFSKIYDIPNLGISVVYIYQIERPTTFLKARGVVIRK